MSAGLHIYTAPFCGYCMAAKRLLSRANIPFKETKLGGDRARRAELIAETGWTTVPVITRDGQLIGGYQELARLHAQGGLDDLKPST